MTKVKERREGIANLVNRKGYASIEFLAEKYDVSTQTIRRDILALSGDKLVTRHHGGAGSASSLVNISYDVRRISMLDEKQRLAALCRFNDQPGSLNVRIRWIDNGDCLQRACPDFNPLRHHQ